MYQRQLFGQTCQPYMCHGEEDGDGKGEEEVGGQLRQEEGEGEDEDGGDEIEEVKEGQTNHQTKDKRKTKVYKNSKIPLKGVEFVP